MIVTNGCLKGDPGPTGPQGIQGQGTNGFTIDLQEGNLDNLYYSSSCDCWHIIPIKNSDTIVVSVSVSSGGGTWQIPTGYQGNTDGSVWIYNHSVGGAIGSNITGWLYRIVYAFK